MFIFLYHWFKGYHVFVNLNIQWMFYEIVLELLLLLHYLAMTSKMGS